MGKSTKIVLYVVLLLVAGGFGYGCHQDYSKIMNPSSGAAGPATEPGSVSSPKDYSINQHGADLGRMMTLGAVFFMAVVGLSLLLAGDISRWFARGTEKFLFNDDAEGMRDPEYEQAETRWANGEYLEAIQRMRDYLKKHPRQQHVALRIAEIYEADLQNYLAAALEYEEVLKKKLPSERWGWAAIHLCNLYLQSAGSAGKSGGFAQADSE